MKLTKLTNILLGGVLLLGTLNLAQAEDKKVDPSGTYTWIMQGRNGAADRTKTLVLKLEGEKLTGKVSGPGRGGQVTEAEITEAKLTGADISFSVVRTYNDNSFTNKYSAKVGDGVIKGKVEFNGRNGDTQSRDWEAKLQK